MTIRCKRGASRRRRFGAFLLSAAAALVPCGAAHTQTLTGVSKTADDPACANVARLSLPGVRITLAEAEPVGFTPPHQPDNPGEGKGIRLTMPICRVAGEIAPTPVSHIRFEVWLPAGGWNGKYNGVGNGGAAGFIAYGAMALPLARGYAVGSTDTGHRASLFDGGWMFDNPEIVRDFAQRAQHLTALAAKSIVAAYYGRAPAHAYFTGCSNGGGQAMQEAQRFPEDYDGIVAGDAARLVTFEWPGELYMSWLGQGDRAGLIAKLPALHAAVLAACDGRDGLRDGLIEDPERCAFDPATLACPGSDDTPACLTPAQVTLARAFYGGLRDSRSGRLLWPGPALGSELNWAQKLKPAGTPLPQSYMRAFVFHDRGWDYRDPAFDFHSTSTHVALQAADRAWRPVLDADDPDLHAFHARGGKLILYHGWADADIAPSNIVDYYRRALAANGPDLPFYARLFMAPGMNHCGGGEGPNRFDALLALETWVEWDQAPERIVAAHYGNGRVDRTRPLCPFPKSARYSGTGSKDEAVNFKCV